MVAKNGHRLINTKTLAHYLSTAFLVIKTGRSCTIWSLQEFKCVNWRQRLNQDVHDFLVTTSAAGPVNCLDLLSAEIADRDSASLPYLDLLEIKIWKTRTVPFPKDKNPLDEWCRGAMHSFPWLGVLTRRVLDIPATSTAPERLFSTAGNVMIHVSCVITWRS